MRVKSSEVPWLYEKRRVEHEKRRVELMRHNPDGSEPYTAKVESLVYVGVKRTDDDGRVEPDHIVWTNKGIRDAVGGMPAEYAEKYLRPHTPLLNEEQAIITVRTTRPAGQSNKAPQAPEEEA